MIDLYYANSGNSLRALIALEEGGSAFRGHKLDLLRNEHRTPEFLALNPVGAVPVMIDHRTDGEPIVLSQSGAIMLHVAERTGRLIPPDPRRRLAALQWFMLAVSDANPASAALLYVGRDVPDATPATTAFLEGRLLNIMRGCETRLTGRDFLADELSLADLALFPVVRMRRGLLEGAGGFDRLLGWADRIAALPSVIRAVGHL
ncbi:glutathione S-transferase family protein [Azospirillum brasilense]|uniref:glutathione S-transferase family protein n=1 Tax=Azospirillum brasilense TaxID=192 RepID=UPI001EDB20B5|nr:glutathione S-transferase family protein [Azospirillum brasilense]UKJ76235.1 glutathione S-transferase family protein [Azospirillum brasilense]